MTSSQPSKCAPTGSMTTMNLSNPYASAQKPGHHSGYFYGRGPRLDRWMVNLRQGLA
jgi:hypothetical protein